jgi:hypothetical protein
VLVVRGVGGSDVLVGAARHRGPRRSTSGRPPDRT